MSLAQKFGGSTVKVSQPQYETIALAQNITLIWPLESALGVPYVAAEIDVTPSAGGLAIAMPSALLGATGVACIIENLGAFSFNLTDNGGNLIATVVPAQAWIISLTDNTTVNGLWRATLLGGTPSNVQAAALADNRTIQAIGTALQVEIPTNYFAINQNIVAANRGSLNVWTLTTGTGAGVFTLDTAANLGAGWFCFISNQGGGTLTVALSSGTINGQGSVLLQPTVSTLIVCDGVNFNAVGVIIQPLAVSSGGTGATNPTSALINLGGTTLGISIFTSPTTAAVLALLGLSITTFVEATVSTPQVLVLASTLTCFVCTAALSLTLPLTTTLTTKYVFCVYAQGGNVTVTPNAADAINGAVAGASYVVLQGTSAMFTTDANGNWWPFFASSTGTVTSVGLTAPPEFAVTGSPVVGASVINLTKVNQARNLVYAGPSVGGAAAPTFRALVAADIPAGGGAAAIRSYLAGLTLSNDAVTPNTVLDISAGVATDSTQTTSLVLGAPFTKTLAAFVAGTGNGGLFTALFPSTWYHVFLIQHTADGVIDVGFDLLPTAPNIPVGYGLFRRIGSFKTGVASHIATFSQNGDEFLWGIAVVDGNFAVTNAQFISGLSGVPLGVVVNALMRVNFVSSSVTGVNASLLISSLVESGTVNSASNRSLISEGLADIASAAAAAGDFNIRTDTSARISYQTGAQGGNVQVGTKGWIDRRGRDN